MISDQWSVEAAACEEGCGKEKPSFKRKTRFLVVIDKHRGDL